MRVAFYAPLKAPDRGRPSGDKLIANGLITALMSGGHEVELASRFRSREPIGDEHRQRRLADVGKRLADRLIRRWMRQPGEQRPQVWFTYHLYYKAPDWLGPRVADALQIPYVVAEASHAPKRNKPPWQFVHQGTERAIARANAVFVINTDDAGCLRPVVQNDSILKPLAPFIDLDAVSPTRAYNEIRDQFAERYGIERDTPVLVTVAMMRRGVKLASYRALAKALLKLKSTQWKLIVVGDGEARSDVEERLAPFGAKVIYMGRLESSDIPNVLVGCDAYVWPAINEAFGIAFLEAQAAGLPVVASNTRGVPDVVADGVSGTLADLGDDRSFAAAVDELLQEPERRRAMGQAARLKIVKSHGIEAASARLSEVLTSCV